MKFLMTYESQPDAPPPSPEMLAKLGEYTHRMIASGVVVLTGGLVRPSHGIRIEQQGGKVRVTDGPFAESKELIDGFAVIEVADVQAAIAMATEFMGIAGDGRGEILRMFDPGGPPA